jgi:hypothetical protein
MTKERSADVAAMLPALGGHNSVTRVSLVCPGIIVDLEYVEREENWKSDDQDGE